MKRRSACLAFALIFALAVSFAAFPAYSGFAISDAEFVAPEIEVPEMLPVPDDDMITDGGSYILGQGSRYEIEVHRVFIDPSHRNRPVVDDSGNWSTQRYIMVHNTSNYNPTATAAANCNYCRSEALANSKHPASWHYTVGNDGIYQQVPVNEMAWHAGKNSGKHPDVCQSTTIGIETCDNGFPADGTSGGQHWDSQEMYEWFANQFDTTATYLAMHVACLCVRLNFNPYTQVCQHNTCSDKNCPMIMRYVFGTNASFKYDGTYFKVFLDRMYDYYKAFGGTYIESDTVINTYCNPNPAVVYHKGLYKTTDEIKAYRAGNIETGEVGTVPADSTVDVKIVGYDWGKIVLADGTAGWIALKDLSYIGDEHDCGTYRDADGNIVEVTKIDGNTAYYDGGSADIGTLTRVYKVEVEGDTAFGAEPKYLASGETFTVTAAAPEAPFVFDIWETTKGVAEIADKEAATTTIKVLNTDVGIKSSARDNYKLTVISGTGSGKYAKDTPVEITARTMLGYKFKNWTLQSGSGSFADPNAYTTVFTTGEADTQIRANYETSKNIDLTGLTNYALHKPYTTTWNGTTDFEYYSVKQSDPDLTKITDGVTVPANFGTGRGEYVSFKGTAKIACFTIDLGKSYAVKKFVLRDIADNSGSFGDLNDTTIEVELSDDGENFTPVSNQTDTLFFSYRIGDDGSFTQYKSNFTHDVNFDEASGRYARVSFKSTKFCMSISEVEVYGTAGQDGEEPPAPEKYAISVEGGSADKAEAEAGETVTITADAPEEGFKFAGWQVVAGGMALADETAATTTFTMPEGAVKLKADFAELPPAPSEEAFKLTENPIVSENNISKSEDNKYVFVNDGVKAKDLTSKAFAEGVYTAREPDGALALGFSVLKTGMTVEDGAKNSITVIVRGDVNGDGNADNLDASMVLQYDAGLIDAGELMLLAGNVSGDGEFDNLDAVRILQYDAGNIEKF